MSQDLQMARRKWFKTLAPVLPEQMVGLWHGEGISSGHPLDGVLENLEWFGKRFQPDLKADALLFRFKPDRLVPIEPAALPIKMAICLAPLGRTSMAKYLFSHLQKVLRARGTTAFTTLRTIDGAETAAMVYDRQPIADFFGRVAEDEVAGMMVVDGDARRYFFRLRKVDPWNPKNVA
jgi:hypothetical protein